ANTAGPAGHDRDVVVKAKVHASATPTRWNTALNETRPCLVCLVSGHWRLFKPNQEGQGGQDGQRFSDLPGNGLPKTLASSLSICPCSELRIESSDTCLNSAVQVETKARPLNPHQFL